MSEVPLYGKVQCSHELPVGQRLVRPAYFTDERTLVTRKLTVSLESRRVCTASPVCQLENSLRTRWRSMASERLLVASTSFHVCTLLMRHGGSLG